MNRQERRAEARKSKTAFKRAAKSSSALCEAGYAHLQSGRLLEAQLCCQEALAAYPEDARTCHLLGLLSLKVEQYEAAVEWVARADWFDPEAGYLLSLGTALQQQGLHGEALRAFDKAVTLKPQDAESWTKRADILVLLQRPTEALSSFERALSHDPGYWFAAHNYGCALQKLGQHEQALEQFDRALALRPNSLEALIGQAVSLTDLGRFGEALAAYQRAKQLDPNHAPADAYGALVLLLRGDFEGGWSKREARWKLLSTANYPKFSKPMWRGEPDISGKTILICADEGLGDTIQFVRYASMVTDLGARVVLLPQESLYPLLKDFHGISQCLPNMKAGLPAFDFHCPITSLPWAFGTTLDTIPASTSYLQRPAAAAIQTWEERLGPRIQPRIGLVWSGNSLHVNDRNRSIPLTTLLRLIVPGASFISLQKDLRPNDKEVLCQQTEIVDLTRHFEDFAATAALISCLDLVVTVDTSVAHLAAALGCPTWILLPFVPDWRWLLDRQDSPWYPSVRLFRQTASRNYAEVVDGMRDALVDFISTKSRP